MKQKITGNYWSPAVICSADKLQPKQPLIFPMTVLFFLLTPHRSGSWARFPPQYI